MDRKQDKKNLHEFEKKNKYLIFFKLKFLNRL